MNHYILGIHNFDQATGYAGDGDYRNAINCAKSAQIHLYLQLCELTDGTAEFTEVDSLLGTVEDYLDGLQRIYNDLRKVGK